MKKSYLLLLFLVAMFLAIVGSNLQHEYIPAITDNDTVPASLRSVPDSDPADSEDNSREPGWWLHKGHSYVSGVVREHAGNGSLDADVNLVILLNGQDESIFPGPELVSGSQVTIEYCVTNTGNIGFDNVIISDTLFGEIGEYKSLDAGENISFVSSVSVQEGQFSSTGKVVAFNESISQTCDDEHRLHYFGIRTTEGPVSEIPEFPTILFPVTMVIGAAFIYGRKVQ